MYYIQGVMFDLPSLCIGKIIEHVAHSTSLDEGAKCAAILCQTSKEGSELANIIFDHIDNGCVKNLTLKKEKRAKDLKIIQDILTKQTVTIKNSLIEIKAECKKLGCPVSGTKTVLLERLATKDPLVMEAQQKCARKVLDSMVPIAKYKCPVRSIIRQLARAKNTAISATEAKELGAKETHLSKIHVTFARNPFYRSAGPMRLFGKKDVLEQIAIDGPGSDGIQDLMEQYEKSSRLLKKSILLQQKLAKRKEQLGEFLQEAGMQIGEVSDICHSTIDNFLNNKMTLVDMKDDVMSHTKQIHRRRNLVEHLAVFGCELRDDSKLCKAYIDSGHGDPLDIATIMCEMKFYYEHTNYNAVLQCKYMSFRENQGYYRDYMTAEFDHEHYSQVAKDTARATWLKKFPFQVALDQSCLPESIRNVFIKEKAFEVYTSTFKSLTKELDKEEVDAEMMSLATLFYKKFQNMHLTTIQ
jgi:hypothetical protein